MRFSISKKKAIQSILFLTAGLLLFWYVYRDVNISEIKENISKLTFGWIFLSIFLNITSQYIRAIRWKMLIKPMGYKPTTKNLFLAILVLCITNLIIPRGGELARGAVVTKYEKIPFVKLFGTVVVERIIDLFVLIILFALVLIWQYPYFMELLNAPDIRFDFSKLTSKVFLIVGIVLGLAILGYILARLGVIKRIRDKMQQMKSDFSEGLHVFSKTPHKWSYFLLSVLVYFLWLMMLYVIFFAYEPTRQLSFGAAIFTFAAATFAFIIPVQAGMGAWHFMVVQGLLLFGIDKQTGLIFALVAHTFTNLIYLVLGGLGLIALPIVNTLGKQNKID